MVARVGAFAGFGGDFQGVPEVLETGDEHRIVVRSGAEVLAIEADVFGWVSRAGDAAGAAARRVQPPLLSAVKALLGPEPGLRADGLVLRGGEQAAIPELAGALHLHAPRRCAGRVVPRLLPPARRGPVEAAAVTAPADAATPETSWQEAWPAALAAWSAYTLLREPTAAGHPKEANREGLGDGIAAIRLRDQAIMVNARPDPPPTASTDHALAILAHEVGHHVYVPGNLTDNARLLAAVRPVAARAPGATSRAWSPTSTRTCSSTTACSAAAGHRHGGGLRRAPGAGRGGGRAPSGRVYTRDLEHLWRQPPGTTVPRPASPRPSDADARSLARIVRTFAGDWLRGAPLRHGPLPLRRRRPGGQPGASRSTARPRRHAPGRAGRPPASATPTPSRTASPRCDAAEPGDDGFDASLDDPLAAEGEPRSATEAPQEKDGPSGSQGQARHAVRVRPDPARPSG